MPLPPPDALIPVAAPAAAPRLFLPLTAAVSSADALSLTDIAQCMYRREHVFHPHPRYMDAQPHLQPRMRAILFDWMMEVGQEFSLGRETLHLAFNATERYGLRGQREKYFVFFAFLVGSVFSLL